MRQTITIWTFAFAIHFGVLNGVRAQANLPDGAVASFGDIPFVSGTRIHASELSPDGKLLATLSERSATVWDTATGQPVHRFFFDIPARGGGYYQHGLAFSPDGKRLACSPPTNFVVIWDLARGKELRRIVPAAANSWHGLLGFSADGAAIVLESKGVLSWIDIETGAPIKRILHGQIVKLSPDEKTFVAVEEEQKQVLIGDAATGKIRHTLPIAARSGFGIQGVAFLSDGVSLAVVSHEGHSIHQLQFWDFTTGKRQDRTWPLSKTDGREPYRLVLSPDGKTLYIPQQRKCIQRYSLIADEELPPINLNGEYDFEILPHPDGRMLFTVDRHAIRRWDAATGAQISKDSDFVNWNATAISQDGRWLARRGYRYQASFLELCDLESRVTKRIDWPSVTIDIAFTSDSRSLALNQYSHIQFLSVPDFKEGKRLALPEGQSLGDRPINFSKDGRFAAVRSEKGELHVVELATDKNVTSLPKIDRALFSPDGKKLLTVSFNHQFLNLYDIATQEALFERAAPTVPARFGRGEIVPFTALAFSPEGGLCALAMSGGQLVLLDATTGKERSRIVALSDRQTPIFNAYDTATALAFSADGQWLAIGGTDGYVRIWDVNSRHELHRLHGHDEATRLLTFSPDSRQLLSFGDKEGLRWDLRPRKTDKAPDPFGDLSSVDGPTAYRAIWALADDQKGPAILRRQIPPKKVDARPERIARLIGDLDSGVFKVRDAAMKSLAELEGCARPALAEALQAKPSLEVKRRIETLLDEPTPELSRQASHAVRAMELSGNDDARTLLREWSSGTPGLRLTDEARAALARHGLNTRPGDTPRQ